MKVLLVVYDNDSYIASFPTGLAYIASALIKNGHSVEVYDQAASHYPDEHLTYYLNKNIFDVIGVGVIGGYYQYKKLLSISTAINNSVNRPFYIIGGHGPSPEPVYFLKKTGANVVVIGEGELVVVNVLKAIENNESLQLVNGIAYVDLNGEYKVNQRQSLIKDVDTIPIPSYDLFSMDFYKLGRQTGVKRTEFHLAMITGRGCVYNCNFCYRMDKGFRPRSNDSILDEMWILKKNYGIGYFSFLDELLLSSPSRAIDFSEAIIRSGINVGWYCNGRLNNVTKEVVRTMKRAGCRYINYGIECFDDQILINMNKHLTTDQIVRGVELTLAEGITPGLNVIFGNIGENKRTLNQSLNFILKYSDNAEMRTIRPVTPYPGSPLYYYAIEKGMLKDVADFYENKHLNSDLISVNFTDISDEEFYSELSKANVKLIERYFDDHKNDCIKQCEEFYTEKDVNFRGFRTV